MKPVARLRVYPENKSLYYVVNVWPTRKAMYEHCRTALRFTGRFLGLCSTTRWRQGGRTLPLMGEVNLFRGELGTSVITHEFFHATLGWARRVGIDMNAVQAVGAAAEHPSNPDPKHVAADEERLAYAHGEMCRQFTDRMYRLGIY